MIRATIDRLLAGRWTDAEGTRKLVPEDVIAEVQVLDPIGPDLIIGAVVKDAVIATALEHVMHEIERVRPVKIIEDVFR